jgi:hypothetical protein
MARPRPSRRRLIMIVAVGLIYLTGAVIARRRGYNFGTRTVVRCHRGHIFTTIWIPGASLKSLRLGWWRIQRCPVGGHWSIVAPVRTTLLTDAERHEADTHHDFWLP